MGWPQTVVTGEKGRVCRGDEPLTGKSVMSCRFKMPHFLDRWLVQERVGLGWSRGRWEGPGRSLGPAGTSLAPDQKADSPQSSGHYWSSLVPEDFQPHGSGKRELGSHANPWFPRGLVFLFLSRAVGFLDRGGEQKPGAWRGLGGLSCLWERLQAGLPDTTDVGPGNSVPAAALAPRKWPLQCSF